MVDTPTLNMKKARTYRTRRRSRINVEKYHDKRKNYFMDAGFTNAEAEWAAMEGVGPGSQGIRSTRLHVGVVDARRALIRLYTGSHYNMSRDKAIRQASLDRKSKLKQTQDEEDIFVDVSP